jgi:hypothetical protein
MEDYDRLVNEHTLFSELERGLMSGGESEGWVLSSDVRVHFEKRALDGR